jgi:hypothetical protein
MKKNITLFYDKIILGDNITGMIMAPVMNAVFIPVSFKKPFSWDYSNNIDIPNIDILRKNFIFKNKIKDEDYTLSSPDGQIDIKYYDYEILKYYSLLLSINGLLFDEFSTKKAIQITENCINLESKFGIEYIINYNKLYVINPSREWFTSLILKTSKSVRSNHCHAIYHLKLSKNSSDMKGVVISCDMENIEHELFDKIYYSHPFSPKKYLKGYSPFHKVNTLSTRNICFFANNKLKKDINSEIYSTVEVRKEIYKYLSVYNRRIAERYFDFDENIEKMITYTDIDLYKNTDTVEFIYYEDKEEIICQRNLQLEKLSGSFQLHTLNLLNSIINSTYSCQSIKM